MPHHAPTQNLMWAKQPIIMIRLEPPTYEEWHPVIDVDEPIKLNYLTSKQINDETLAKTIGMRAILNGIELANSKSFPNDETEFYNISGDADALADNVGMQLFNWRESFVASNAQIDVRITDALGTNQRLWANLHYCLLEAIT